MPIFSRDLIIFFIDSSTLSKDLAPVQTIFPEENIKAEVFGSLILITNPGNCSGLYSVLLKVAAIFSKGMSCLRDVLITMFTTFISRLSAIFLLTPHVVKNRALNLHL